MVYTLSHHLKNKITLLKSLEKQNNITKIFEKRQNMFKRKFKRIMNTSNNESGMEDFQDIDVVVSQKTPQGKHVQETPTHTIEFGKIWKKTLETLDGTMDSPIDCPDISFLLNSVEITLNGMKTHIGCTPFPIRLRALALYILNFHLYITTNGHDDHTLYNEQEHKNFCNDETLVEIGSNDMKDFTFSVNYLIHIMRENGRIFNLRAFQMLVCDTNRVQDAFDKMYDLLEVRVAFKLLWRTVECVCCLHE
jgi:hypothetical protein